MVGIGNNAAIALDVTPHIREARQQLLLCAGAHELPQHLEIGQRHRARAGSFTTRAGACAGARCSSCISAL